MVLGAVLGSKYAFYKKSLTSLVSGVFMGRQHSRNVASIENVTLVPMSVVLVCLKFQRQSRRRSASICVSGLASFTCP
jgi:hypothetical protein